MEIILPVTPFTYKVITARHGHPVSVNRQDNKELYMLLQLKPLISPDKQKELLSEPLRVETTKRLAHIVLKNNIHAIGIHLHHHYLQKLYEFIYAQMMAGHQAYSSMEYFYELHDVEEDDFGMDSAYRGWLRFQEKLKKSTEITESVNQNNDFNVLRIITTLKSRSGGGMLRPDVVETTMKKIFLRFDEHIESTAQYYSATRCRRIYIYLLRELSSLTYTQIAQRANITTEGVRKHLYITNKALMSLNDIPQIESFAKLEEWKEQHNIRRVLNVSRLLKVLNLLEKQPIEVLRRRTAS